jgi:hypothetical protein
LLVGAKAHESELKRDGKALKTGASEQSRRNHEHITGALDEANRALGAAVHGDVNISVTTHYQLANRLAWTWKLAECGLPVVLLYLGFTGDTYFEKDYFRDAAHWQRAMGAYMEGVVPIDLPGKAIAVGKDGSFSILVKEVPVKTPSRRSSNALVL